jgi:hypothetical protein
MEYLWKLNLGGYYAYIFARMYAAQIWSRQFKIDPLSRYKVFKISYFGIANIDIIKYFIFVG